MEVIKSFKKLRSTLESKPYFTFSDHKDLITHYIKPLATIYRVSAKLITSEDEEAFKYLLIFPSLKEVKGFMNVNLIYLNLDDDQAYGKVNTLLLTLGITNQELYWDAQLMNKFKLWYYEHNTKLPWYNTLGTWHNLNQHIKVLTSRTKEFINQ